MGEAKRRRRDRLASLSRDRRGLGRRVGRVASSSMSLAIVNEAKRLAAVHRYDILDSPPDGAFDRVCALAARVLDVPIATVSIVDEDRIWFKARSGLTAAQLPRESGLCSSAILQDEPYVVSDALTDSRTVRHSLITGEPGVRFYAAAPIVTVDGYRLGTVNVIDIKPREMTAQETRTLSDLAAIVMDELEVRLAAMQEVQREREHRERALAQQRLAEQLARTLQRSLSPPRLPDLPGLQVAAHYQPFSEYLVGGDFYDLFSLGDGRWGVFLGDVCGKGPEAARLTSLARYTLRAAAMHREGPATILLALNTALLMDDTVQMAMCSAVYGEINATDGDVELSLAVAGHPAPLIVRTQGLIEPAAARGTVLGAFTDPVFESCQVSLHPGDAIVLYSDGLLDAQLDGACIDEERLAEILSGAPRTGARDLIAHIKTVLRHLDAPLRDDVAVMALSRAPNT